MYQPRNAAIAPCPTPGPGNGPGSGPGEGTGTGFGHGDGAGHEPPLRGCADRGTLRRMNGVLPSWWKPWSQRDVRVGPALVLPTGKIVACDPLVFLPRAKPFALSVAPGTYPVEIGFSYRTVGYAAVVIDPAPVVAWRPAQRPGEAEPSDPRKPRGYGVDAGTGCFVDVLTAQRWTTQGDGVDLLPLLNRAGYDRRDVATVTIEGALGGNLVVFRSGDGDGTYCSYWGIDAAGAPVVLMTDFGIFIDFDAWDAAPGSA